MYPVNFTAGQAGERSRGLGWAGVFFFIKSLLALPHLIIINILGNLAFIVAYVGFFFVGFTGKMPDGLRSMLVATMRWSARTYAWMGALTDLYPPFVWEEDDYPARLTVGDAPETPSRGLAWAGIFFIKFILLIPHIIALALIFIGVFFAAWFGFFKIAFTGQSSQGTHDFITGSIRWAMRASAWLYGLTDEYPPFRLAE